MTAYQCAACDYPYGDSVPGPAVVQLHMAVSHGGGAPIVGIEAPALVPVTLDGETVFWADSIAGVWNGFLVPRFSPSELARIQSELDVAYTGDDYWCWQDAAPIVDTTGARFGVAQ